MDIFRFAGWRRLWIILLLAIVPGTAQAGQGLAVALLAPAEPVTAGSRAGVWLYAVNDSSAPLSPSLPPSFEASLRSGSNALATTLVLSTNNGSSAAAIAPAGFARSQYQFTVPDGLAGLVTLEVSNYNPVTLLVLAGSAPPATAPVAKMSSLPSTAVQTNASGSDQMADYLRRRVESHVSYYEPIYFLLGNPIAEFQLSLKYQIFGFQNQANPLANVADHSYFAYTQTSYWDLLTPDPYFYDNSYKPSFFIYYTNVLRNANWQLDLQGGTEHESNGRGGVNERSLYTGYLQPTLTIALPENFSLSLQPRARLYYWVGHNDTDIANYRGYADLLAALTWQKPDSEERISFATKYRVGDEGANPGWLFDLRFNLAALPGLNHFNPTIQLQYFTGYGQTLLQYNQKSSAFRAGLCLWY
jgi:outer membrane phospholipase A